MSLVVFAANNLIQFKSFSTICAKYANSKICAKINSIFSNDLLKVAGFGFAAKVRKNKFLKKKLCAQTI